MPVSNSIIEQEPLYDQLPVGQEVIFVVSNQDAVANQTKVKFCAEVHISPMLQPNPNSSADIIGTFKTTPNNAGVGIFDLRSIVENYVKADNMAHVFSSYKGTQTTSEVRHPIHLIDKYTMNQNIIRYMVIVFYVEYLGATSSGVSDENIVARADGTDATSNLFTLFNGYLKYTDILTKGTVAGGNANNFGYDISDLQVASGSTGSFLSNAPLTQYANQDDYGTFAFLVKTGTGSFADGYLDEIDIQCYDASDSPIGGLITVTRGQATGAYDFYFANTQIQLLYFGCFPGNLRNWSTIFQTQLATGNLAYYSVRGSNSVGGNVTQRYIINVNCPDGKGYESIRLCWLNQWGTWDYYTFTKRSNTSISTKGATYTQLQGTWNDSVYTVDSFKGGKKAFRVNSTEKIQMNTDFVSEDDNVMFEELINSPEVYQLQGYQTDSTDSALNQYVTPVRLTTSSFTRKTIANDKLIQYTFEVEKTKTLRTQAV
jgi:hypothetical protein